MITNLLKLFLEQNRKNKLHLVLNDIIEQFPLRQLIFQLINDEEAISLIANNSYAHSNGFTKIVLAELGLSDIKLRLHIWQSEEHFTDNHIHNHAWNYSSFVCAGFLSMDLFKESIEGDYLLNKIKVGNLANKNTVECGIVSLEKYEQKKILRGDLYSLDADKIHKISTNKYTATLVLQGEHISNYSCIYTPETKTLKNPYSVTKLSPETLKSQLKLFLEKISER